MSLEESNPISTEDQQALERHALKLFADPQLVATMKEVKAYWLQSAHRSDEAVACLEWAFEEVMFAALVWSLNQDPLYPRVITITRLAHSIGNLSVPGSRWGIDNPDSVYRVIPISGAERYVIRGCVPKNRVTENYFTLWDEKMGTVDVLNGKDLVLEADGSFEISVDCEPANGRANHVQTTPEAHEFYIRDVLMDWKLERINRLSILRLGAPPSRAPRTRTEELDLAVQYMWKWAKETDRWNQQPEGTPDNQFEYTIDRSTDGALKNQIYVLGTFDLPADDVALVLTIDLGGADYFVAPISNVWGTTLEVQHRTGSLNRSQSIPNEDGTLTLVLSVRDPGVHNWLDPAGMHSGVLTLRWAEFRTGQPEDSLSVSSELVALADLRNKLPKHTAFILPDERIRQLEERARSYSWRLKDH